MSSDHATTTASPGDGDDGQRKERIEDLIVDIAAKMAKEEDAKMRLAWQTLIDRLTRIKAEIDAADGKK